MHPLPINQAQIPFGTPGIPGGMNFAGRDPRSSAPTEAQLREMTETAKQLGGTLQHPSSGSHSLSDYQSQLMVLEQQNKKRLQNARQETNSRNDEPGSGPLTGQFQHQGQLQPGQQLTRNQYVPIEFTYRPKSTNLQPRTTTTATTATKARTKGWKWWLQVPSPIQ